MIKISYFPCAPATAEISHVERGLQKVRSRAMDLPVQSVSELETEYHPDNKHVSRMFGGKMYCPNVLTGFWCNFGDGSPSLSISLMKFPSEGRCPLYWIGEGEFYTLSGMKDEIFLSRHRTAIKILENLVFQNFTVKVIDEGDYWTKRNLSALLDFKKVMDAVKDPRETIVR